MRRISGREFARLLEHNGWVLRRVQGSHSTYAKQGSRVRISVPIHGNRPLKIGLQRSLWKQAELPESSPRQPIQSDPGLSATIGVRSGSLFDFPHPFFLVLLQVLHIQIPGRLDPMFVDLHHQRPHQPQAAIGVGEDPHHQRPPLPARLRKHRMQ
jgi:predicted RNA binding protein YcfA (HicA-like mRNA interferase family)